jgi:hypothetical protein
VELLISSRIAFLGDLDSLSWHIQYFQQNFFYSKFVLLLIPP